jgi:hypothetical protein
MLSLRSLLVALLAGLLPHLASATSQRPDWLIYHRDTLQLFSNPLEQWLEQLPQRPEELRGNGATSCWRGYQATWQLENDRLYLIEVRPCGGKPIARAMLRQWFGVDDSPRIAATWVSGQLDVVRGKLLYYMHMGYGSIYEQDWLLRFDKGQLVGQQTFDNRTGTAQFPPGGETGFARQLYQAIDWRQVPAQSEDAGKHVFVDFRPDSTGHHCEVLLLRSGGMPYDSLALRAARTVAAQEWGVYYRFGRWISTTWTMPIGFTEENRRRCRDTRPASGR